MQLLEPSGTRYAYDAAGSLRKKTLRTGEEWHYAWNSAGHLAEVVQPKGGVVRFQYDALGRRVSKSYKGRVTRWVWDGNNILHEWSSVEVGPGKDAVEELTTWLFEEESFAPLAKLQEQTQWGVVCDHLGTPVELHDRHGGQAWAAELDSYGRVRREEGERNACPFRYQGQYEDVETGLYYNRFRYYDPHAGQYVSQDPIRFKSGEINFYTYVHDTTSWIDPLGLSGLQCPKNKKTSFEAVSRRDAMRQAERDANIPNSQQPSKIGRVALGDGYGGTVKNADGTPIMTREYHYTNTKGDKIIIQEHSLGHSKAEPGRGAEPHFNVRPIDDPGTGSVSGTHGHYNFPSQS